jgi:hypothetical protein
MKTLIEQLRALATVESSIRPKSVWVKDTRATLLQSMVSDTQNTKSSIPEKVFLHSQRWVEVFVPQRLSLVLRPLVSMLLIVAVAAGGWSATVSAANSTPDASILYGIKLASEKIHVAVTPEDDRPELYLKFADRRADDLQKVVEQKKDAAVAKKAVSNLKKSLESVDKSVREVAEKTPEKVEQILGAIDKKEEVITEKIKRTSAHADEVEGLDIERELVETEKIVSETSLKAVELVVERGQVGEKAREIIEKKFDSLVGDAAKTIEQATKAQNITDNTINASSSTRGTFILVSSTIPVVNLTGGKKKPVITSSTDSNNSTDGNVSEEQTAVDVQVEEAVKKAEQTAQTLEGSTEAFKSLVESGQVLEAIQKVKELGALTSETRGAVLDAKKNAETQQEEAKEGKDLVVSEDVNETSAPEEENVGVIESLDEKSSAEHANSTHEEQEVVQE